MRLKAFTTILCLTAIGLSPVPAVLFGPLGGVDSAYAGKGNGGGKGGGGSDRAGKAGKPDKPAKKEKAKANATRTGALASELKGLNAYHASQTAFESAAANSRVGRLASYRDAALAARDAQAAVDAAQSDLDAANQALTDARQALDDAIAAGANAEEIATLEQVVANATTRTTEAQSAYDQTVTEAEGAAFAESEALLSASDGRILTRGTLEYLREQLGISDSEGPAL